MSEKLVYVGKITSLEPIPSADFIVSATVVCGEGGKWKGIVKKADFTLGDLCIVFLPDSQLGPEIHSYLPFMKDSAWRVKMRRFKGAPSEVLITPVRVADGIVDVGQDMTSSYQVFKYIKPIPAHLQGISLGSFPSFIPKTDELNYQRHPELVDQLVGRPYYITEKADGSSTTGFKYQGQFRLCSRNLELERNMNNGYWKVVEKYNLENTCPEGIALQWETCGPGIQGNPMGLYDITGFLFSGYDILLGRYLTFRELDALSHLMPMVRLVDIGESFSKEGIETLGEGKYSNGKPREGVVVRAQETHLSFKVINLDYE